MSKEEIVAIIVALFASQGVWEFFKTVYIDKHKPDPQLEELSALIKTMAKGQVGLLHEQIHDLLTYYERKGSISEARYMYIHDHIYKPYRELGGNDNAEELMEKLKDLIEER